ncbi:MAG: tyrosine-type recombinase/integrase, partial [Pseudomonadota bacterium]
SRTKNGRSHIVPLSMPALIELPSFQPRADTDLVFTTTGRTPVSGFSKVKSRLDEMLGDEFPDWRFHDLRTAFATAMADAGEPEGVVDRVLNHVASASSASAVARTYNRAELLPQRAAALDAWADMIAVSTY